MHGAGKERREQAWWQGLSVITGLAALVWFLARVIPKPSRAAYPCQRAAAPLAGGFVVWVAGLLTARWLHGKARGLLSGWRYGLAAGSLGLAIFAIWLPCGVTGDIAAQPIFTPGDPPNQPMGAGKGIHPGRVVWVHEPEATSWDGKTGNWWDDANTDQKVVNGMLSASVGRLTERQNDKQAWEALFQHFNRTRKLGNVGYRAGEKVAIKINANQDRGEPWRPAAGLPSPHLMVALLEQLVSAAGVPGKDIVIYDASRYIGDPIYKKVRAHPNPEFQAVHFVVRPELAGDGRTEAVPDKNNPVYFADPSIPTAYLPNCLTQAKYLINLAILRGHTMFGVTLTAKNHFGSTYFPGNGEWTPRPLHETGARERTPKSYNSLTELIGHKHISGKTLLYMLDALYASEHQGGSAIRFASFGDDWVSSLFVSQDPVAIDSVGLDFLRNEPKATQVRGNPDNYLHEAALAEKPPSGTVYDPERDRQRLTSLGVHEHWNNPVEKKYSRNLGKREGVELVAVSGRQDDAGGQ